MLSVHCKLSLSQAVLTCSVLLTLLQWVVKQTYGRKYFLAVSSHLSNNNDFFAYPVDYGQISLEGTLTLVLLRYLYPVLGIVTSQFCDTCSHCAVHKT